MSLGASSNPALKNDVFERSVGTGSGTMTVEGTIGKCFILFGLLFLAALGSGSYIETKLIAKDLSGVYPLVYGSLILAFICGLVASFSQTNIKIFAPLYALFEGIAVGIIYKFSSVVYPGIGNFAIVITFVAFLSMLFMYKMKLIQHSAKFSATLSIALASCLVISVISFLIPGMITGGLQVLIGFVFLIIASFCYISDLHLVYKGSKTGAPKYMEWHAAFGLLLTSVWVFLEALQILSYLESDD